MALKLTKFFLYAAIFSVLIVSSTTLFPFIVGKDVFFRAVVDLALIFYLVHWGWEHNAKKKISLKSEPFAKALVKKNWLEAVKERPIFWAVVLFGLVFVISGFFGINPALSFWSNFERGEGGFQMLHYLAFFILLTLVFRDKKSWRGLFIASLFVAVGVLGYGVLAILKTPGFMGFGGNTLLSRVAGSLGNPDYTGTYLLFALFYAAYLFVAERDLRKRILLTLFGAFDLTFLYLTQTRGAEVGLIIGLFAMAAYLAFKLPGGNLKRGVSVILLLMLLLGGGFIAFRQKINVPGCGICNRMLHITISDPTFQTRFWAWGEAIRGWEARPVFGWGPENFSAVFDKYFNINYFVPGQDTETWFDRAHSVYFDYLAETGMVGLAAFLSMFGAFFWTLFRKKREKDAETRLIAGETDNVWERALILGIVTAYLIQGIVLFDVLPIYINLFLVLAFANNQLSEKGQNG